MYDLAALDEKLKTMLSEKRYIHSLGVRDTAVALAERHGLPVHKAEVAGLMHDCAKDFPIDQFIPLCSRYNVPLDKIYLHETKLIHAPLGAAICEMDFKITDEDILEAVTYHTLASPTMSDLAKIIYLADFIEPNRTPFEGLEELRTISFGDDLNKAMLFALDLALHMIVDEGKRIHFSTVDARNYYIDLLQKKI